MAVILSDDQLPDLFASLQDIPRTMHIRGEITSYLNSVITDNLFIVDSWPDYKALVVTVNTKTAKYPGHLGVEVKVYATDTTALETLLQEPGVIDWSSKKFIQCVDEFAIPAVLKTMTNHECILKDTLPYVVMTVTKDSLKVSPIPTGFKLTPLLPKQAHLINSKWKYNNGEHSEMYVKDIVTKLPSGCLYNEEGAVVGFALRYHYGAIGMLHVLEEFRGKGYAKVIMSQLAYSCLQNDDEVFLEVDLENIPSVKLNQSIGFEEVPDSKLFAFTTEG